MKKNNDFLIKRLKAIRSSLMAQHLSGEGLPAAQVGSERETFLREFLQKVFPAHRRFSTGTITDSRGARSGQIDIALEYGFVPSFPMPATEERLLLAESVALVIEVKSDLSAQWDQVRTTTRKVRTLRSRLNPTITFGSRPSELIPVVAVGYRGYKTIDGLVKRLEETPEKERPDAALVIESGCFVGFNMKTAGPLGLYTLCIGINSILSRVESAAPNLLTYVNSHSDTQ